MSTEPNSDPSGQRLHWWAQESTAPKSYASTEIIAAPTAVSQGETQTVPTELWAELEAEAQRRAQLKQNAVAIEGRAITLAKWRMQLAQAILVAATIFYIGWGALSHNGVLSAMSLIFVYFYFVLGHYLKIRSSGYLPTIEISPAGFTADLPYFHLGPVHWEEVAGLGTRKIGRVDILTIYFKDPKKTMARAYQVKNSPLKWLLQETGKRNFVNVSLGEFSVSSLEVAERMIAFRPTPKENKNESE